MAQNPMAEVLHTRNTHPHAAVNRAVGNFQTCVFRVTASPELEEIIESNLRAGDFSVGRRQCISLW